jgi:hypothetical protein
MVMTALMIAAAGATASMSVGATVVREEPVPRPAIAVARDSATIRNVAGVAVSAEGGTVHRSGKGQVIITGAGAATLLVTLTY